MVYNGIMEHSEQGGLLSRIIRACMEIEDVKIKKHFWNQIVEEVLTRRPFTRHLSLLLLEDS
jgi:hypothetical protein